MSHTFLPSGRKFRLSTVLQALLLCACVSGSSAAIAADDLQKYYNPQPLPDDVLVSMPCDLKMAFRKVYTSAASERMQDTRFEAGADDTQVPVSQTPNRRYIQGSFHDKNGYYFLMAKYEMSALQYHALMDDKCPKPNAKMLLPVNDISWFDAMEAGRRYSMYLGTAKDAPKQEDTTAFARLPTDSEFEFAVRGGMNAGEAQFKAATFVTEGALRDYAWYQGSQSANGRLQQIGRLKANPLGLHDMLGNVQEMTSDPFYATRAGRLHGQSGGFTARGGSYLTAQAQMTSAYRVEKPYYQKGKELRAKDMGMRLVLSVPVLNKLSDVNELNEEVLQLGTDKDKENGTLKQLNAIITEQNKNMAAEQKDLKAQNSKMSQALQDLRNEIIRVNAENEENRNIAIVNNLKVGGMLCLSIANTVPLVDRAERDLKLAKDNVVYKMESDETKREALRKITEKRIKEREQQLTSRQDALTLYTVYLANQLASTTDLYDVQDLQKQLPNALHDNSGLKNNMGAFVQGYFEEARSYAAKHPQDFSAYKEHLIKKCHAISLQGQGKTK